MSRWIIQPGVVLVEIHGVYLLVSDLEARKHCRYLRQVSELGARIWTLLSNGKSRDEITSMIREEYDVPEGTRLGEDVDRFLGALQEKHYIIREAVSHEV